MSELFTVDNLFTLLMLVFLQAVLGFDNLLYISIESKRVAADKQQMVRKLGIGLAIGLRIVLLFVVVQAIAVFSEPFTSIHLGPIVEAEVSVHSLIVLVGGAFILYTAVKEIFHMLSMDDLDEGAEDQPKRSPGVAIAWIVVMNLVFSFDSILSAIALTNVLAVMATAIIISGIMMMVLADRVSDFLQKNRMYEVLGLFILFLVGVMLISEGGHLAHLHLAGHAVEAMPKSTFYFVLIVLVVVDIAQGRYQKKIELERERQLEREPGLEHKQAEG
jgi:predicted tellurium resistance membrane protein TerC